MKIVLKNQKGPIAKLIRTFGQSYDWTYGCKSIGGGKLYIFFLFEALYCNIYRVRHLLLSFYIKKNNEENCEEKSKLFIDYERWYLHTIYK